ncbi:MAG: hypothetical protein ACREDF_03815 [Thermoplasmata archaeon]
MGSRDDSGHGGRAVEIDASHSVQAGLIAMFFVGTAIATFGPFFQLSTGLGLLVCAFLAAAFGLRAADRAGHANASSAVVRRDVLAGRLLAVIALICISYLTGVWLLLVALWPLVLFVGLLAWAVHRSRTDRTPTRQEVRT